MGNVDAKAIARAALNDGIIPESVQSDILGAKAKDAANYILFEHLRSQAKLEDLRKLCKIMTEAKGCSKMMDFGKKLRSRLDKVANSKWCNVSLYARL